MKRKQVTAHLDLSIWEDVKRFIDMKNEGRADRGGRLVGISEAIETLIAGSLSSNAEFMSKFYPTSGPR